LSLGRSRVPYAVRCGAPAFSLLAAGTLPSRAASGNPPGRALRLEGEGQGTLAHSDFALAIEDFRAALNLNPNSVDAHSGLGIALCSATAVVHFSGVHQESKGRRRYPRPRPAVDGRMIAPIFPDFPI